MELLQPSSLEELDSSPGLLLAGGTDVVPIVRNKLIDIDTLVDIRAVVPRGIDGTKIGGGTTLAELEIDPQIPDALREACALAASPQLRTMGTIGGNLRQATRCWYWRLRHPCRLHGGERCFARDGEHREHAIAGNDFCASAHPSDPAAALLALGATVRTDRRALRHYNETLHGIVDLGVEIGVQGAGLAFSALGEVVAALASGEPERAERRVERRAEPIKESARELCKEVQALVLVQESIASRLPAFRPYAVLEEDAGEDCLDDLED